MTVVNGMADPSERRQKADAVLIRSLLDAAALGLRVEKENVAK
jgi:hypothetical protein